MRKIYLSLLFISGIAIRLDAQSVSINTDGSSPHASSILDIKSTAKGLLIPRMNSSQRAAIPAPATGLMVFDTTSKTFWYFNGSNWTNISAGWSLGGNSGTNSATQFIGTLDNVPLLVKANGELSGQVGPMLNNNTSWGYRALKNNNGGYENVALGSQAMFSNTTGGMNTAVGSASLYYNTSGYNNSAVGFQSLTFNTIGIANTAHGTYALFNNTTGNNNTATGNNAMVTNSTGGGNTAVGSYSLYFNTSGNDNVAIGYSSLQTNTTGNENTAVGTVALFTNGIGSRNAATGKYSMYQNTSGSDNASFGYGSMGENTEGNWNTAVGGVAMSKNTTGTFNTAIGYESLFNNVTGSHNTASGVYALYYTSTGSSNTSLGDNSMTANTTGNFNTALGADAGTTAGDLTNATAVGYYAAVNASNKVRIGNAAVTVIEGQVPFTSPSDGRFKYNVREDVKGLDFIMRLRPLTYQFDVKKFDAQLHSNQKDYKMDNVMQASLDKASAIRRTGFIAQEVEQAAIKTGYDFSGIVKPQSENDHYSLSYESFVVPLVKAVQEQQKIIEELKKRIELLEKRTEDVK